MNSVSRGITAGLAWQIAAASGAPKGSVVPTMACACLLVEPIFQAVGSMPRNAVNASWTR